MVSASSELSLRGRLARSVFWIAWSRGVLQIIGFATTLIVARILMPADYGVMAIASIWTASVGLLAEMGLGAAIVQFRDLGPREINTCFWITMTLATMGFAILALSAPIIACWFDIPRLGDVLPVLALVLPVTACAWSCGFSHGILLSLGASVAWHMVDSLENPALPPAVRVWNGVVRFCTLALMASLVSRLRVAHAKQGETIDALSRRTGNAWDIEKTAVANGFFGPTAFLEGQPIKIALTEPYHSVDLPIPAAAAP